MNSDRISSRRGSAGDASKRAPRAMLTGAALVIGISLTTAACSGTRPSRDWCAFLSEQGTIDCSYDSFRQCQAMISGVGGSCAHNPALRQSEDPPRRRRQR